MSDRRKLNKSGLTVNELSTRLLIARSKLLGRAMDDRRRDINAECGYPEDGALTASVFREWFEREGIANRACCVYADECWSIYPELVENEKEELTLFEEAWEDLNFQIPIWHYLHRVDVVSGIGGFGLLLMGFNDGRGLETPVLKADGTRVTKKPLKLVFLQTFDESLVRIQAKETNPINPRYGQPTMYAIRFEDPNTQSSSDTIREDTETLVHWSRVIHVTDNRITNEIHGIPRLKPIANRLYDCRKILGGSGEMFWKGAQPGWAFTSDSETGIDVDFDADSLKDQWEAYSNGLQRYLALIGMKPHSLAPQVADPTNHLQQHLQVIAATLGVPLRIFLGSESGHLASTQDSVTWNRRLFRRQTSYIFPMIISPFVKRLIALGILPEVKRFKTIWTDLNAISDKDKADVSLKKAQAILQYVTSGAEKIIPAAEFFSLILGMSLEQAKAVVASAKVSPQMTKEVWSQPQVAPGNPKNSGKKKPKTSRPSRNSLGGSPSTSA